MDWLGITLSRADLERWLTDLRDYAVPHLADTLMHALIGALLFVLARWIIARVEARITSKTRSLIDDHLIAALRRGLSITIVMWVLWSGAAIWNFNERVLGFVEAIWIVAITFPLASLVTKLLKVAEKTLAPRTKTSFDDTALPMINKAAQFLILCGGVITALSHINVDIFPLIAGASVLGVAIGFAAKDTLSNLIAGVLLIIDRPFEVGDRIELWTAPRDTATWGDVVEVGLRATKIRNPDNLIFVIPNNQIMQRDIVNYTASGDNIRLRIPIGIAYDADPEKAKKIIHAVALDVAGVLHEPAPVIIIRNFGQSSVDLQLRVWIAEARKRRAIIDEITERVKMDFDRAGLEIPYAKRDLYIRTMPKQLAAADPSPQEALPASKGDNP